MKRSTGGIAPEERDVLFEGLVAQLLRAYKDDRGICDEIYYWAPSSRSETEIDFLLVRGADLIAIEVKSGQTFTDTWCKGLRAVAEPKGMCRRILIYPRGPVLRTEDGIAVYPFQHFSDLLAGNSL